MKDSFANIFKFFVENETKMIETDARKHFVNKILTEF